MKKLAGLLRVMHGLKYHSNTIRNDIYDAFERTTTLEEFKTYSSETLENIISECTALKQKIYIL